MTDAFDSLKPAAIGRQIQALITELRTLTTAKAAATAKPSVSSPPEHRLTAAHRGGGG